eukprot:327749-Chlamydomonas_euryale.AAC.3
MRASSHTGRRCERCDVAECVAAAAEPQPHPARASVRGQTAGHRGRPQRCSTGYGDGPVGTGSQVGRCGGRGQPPPTP